MRSVTDDVWALADQVKKHQLTAVELVQRFLADLVSPWHREINAMASVDEARALDSARRVDAAIAGGDERLPLAGVPFGVKELQQVSGWPDTLGSLAFADRVAAETDTMVERLVVAGAVPVGLTTSPELGRSSFCSTELHGTTRNPWDLSRTTGGSSSGSAAAVASGLIPFATGSDGAGSLRIPASFCGVVGFKPSAGVVPRGPKFGGVAGNQAYGVLTTTVRDTALILDVLAGAQDSEWGSVPSPGSFIEALTRRPEGLRVGFSADLGYSPLDADVRLATSDAFHRVVEAVDGVEIDLADRVRLPDSSQAFRLLSMLDIHAQVRGLDDGQKDLLGSTVRQYSDLVREASFDDYLQAHMLRADLTRTVAEIFEHVDVLVTPTTPVLPFGAEGPMPREIDGESVDHWGSLRLTYPFNLTGHPAVSIPIARTGGAPVGLQLVTRRYHDPLLMTVAAAAEEANPWPRHAMSPMGEIA